MQELHALDTINFSTSQAFNSLTASICECALMIMKSIAYSSHTIKEKSKKAGLRTVSFRRVFGSFYFVILLEYLINFFLNSFCISFWF